MQYCDGVTSTSALSRSTQIGYQNRRASVKFSPIWPIESNELKGREKEHGIDSVTNVDEAIREASESGKVSPWTQKKVSGSGQYRGNLGIHATESLGSIYSAMLVEENIQGKESKEGDKEERTIQKK
ncbi:hypothetical protein Lal_00006149 [Lupinus albus]|nr:hypothetical protein Lal_00006149 [Lupinus albus]